MDDESWGLAGSCDAMRIAVLDPYPVAAGGSERMLASVARGLAERGHRIDLIFGEERDLLADYRAFAGSCIRLEYPKFGMRRVFSAVREAAGFRAVLQGLGSECLLAADVSQFGGLGTVALTTGLPLVLHLGVNVEGAVRRMCWVRYVARAGIAPSEHTARSWAAAGWPRRRLHVVPNWVDEGSLLRVGTRAVARRQLSLDPGAPLIVYLGRIVPEKGVETLLRAWGCMGGGATLALVGAAPAWFKLKIDALVQELGPVNDRWIMPGPTRESAVWLRAADLAVVPSEWEEPFGLVAVESIACGTLPIVSASGFLPEIVGPENGDLVFPKGDAEALARLLARWLPDSDEKRNRIEALQSRVAEKFSPERGVDAYERILRDACSRKSAPRRSAV